MAMKYDTHLAEVAKHFEEMGVDNDDHLQYDYDPESQTLRIHVLTQEELDGLAGYKESDCSRCAHVSGCPHAHGSVHPCDAFIDKEDVW